MTTTVAESASAERATSPNSAHGTVEQRVHALAESSSTHPAVDNQFYDLWMNTRLSADHVELVARNFYERVRETPYRLALAVLHVNDIRARSETVENLNDEMGEGDPSKAHTVLLKRFFEELLSRMHGRPVVFEQLDQPILPSTAKVVSEGREVFSSPSSPTACGALLAQEWHAYPQLVKLYEGARNYSGYFGLEEFHENCEFFYLHIGATEKEHKRQSLSTAAALCKSEEDVVALEHGFSTYLNLLAAHWAEIHEAIVGDRERRDRQGPCRISDSPSRG